MELCYASAAPARDVCFVESGEADTLPATSLQQLMGSGIVGCLHQFPLGTRGRVRGEEAGFVSATCFLQAGRSYGTNIYIYDNQMPHFSLEVEVDVFKGQEQNVVSVV